MKPALAYFKVDVTIRAVGRPAKNGEAARHWWKMDVTRSRISHGHTSQDVAKEQNLMLSLAAEVEEIRLPGTHLRVLIDGPTTGASLTMFEMDVMPGGAMPVPHYHLKFDEVLHCTAGQLRVTVQGQEMDVSAGDSLLIKGGEVHAFANPFGETAEVLCVLTPGVFGAGYFRETQGILATGLPPDPQQIGELMLRHGLVPARPESQEKGG